MNTFVFVSPGSEIKIIVMASSIESAMIALDSRLEDLKLLRVFGVFINAEAADFSLHSSY